MIRNYKAFGLAVVAMFAFSAFVAQVASANPLTTPGGKVFYTGDQDSGLHEFKTPSGTVKCTTAVFTANSEGASVNELNVTPSYSGCTAFGFASSHVKPNGCTYKFTTPTKIKAGEVTWTGSKEEAKAQLHIVCAAGKSIEITPTTFGVSVCTQFVAGQTPTEGHVIGTNAGTAEKMDITLDIALKGIHYTGTGGACGNSETHGDAEYNGKSTVRCFSDEKHEKQVSCTFS